MIDPYADNEHFIQVQPGRLIEGNQYNLAINVLPRAPYEQTEQPFTEENMIFIRHAEDRGILVHGEIVHTLIFHRWPMEMVVVNHSLNRIYRRKVYSDYTLGEYTKPGTPGWRAINKGLGRGHPLLKKEMNKFGGKRKKTVRKKKKKAIKSKKSKKGKKTKKTKNLIGGMEQQPPSLHPERVHMDHLVVGNEYEFLIQVPNETEERIYHGTLMPLTHQNLLDPPFRISNYTINGVPQVGFHTFPRSFIRAIRAEPSAQQPSGGGKKKKRRTKKKKKTQKRKKSKKTKK